jgi:HemY protein
VRQLLGYLLRAAVVIGIVMWLTKEPGTARIVWHGYVIESSAILLALIMLAIGYALYLLLRLWYVVRNGPALWRMGRQLKKLQLGQDLLTQGLVAVAGGNAAEAGRLAIAARKKLGETTATMLLQAQAAQLAHDHRTARAIFRAMIEDEESAVLGYRGLIMEARRDGEWGEVRRLSTLVEQLKPDMPWLDWVRFEGAARRQAWDEAGQALSRLASAQLLEQQTLRRYRAALLLASSQEEIRQGNPAAALEFAEQAVKQAPDWSPALINLARRQAAGDFGRAVKRTVEKGWATNPHPQLAEVLRMEGKEPITTYKLLERLCRGKEDDPASRMVLAEAAIDADIWGEARRHLMFLIAHDQATQATYRQLARLERRESGNEKAYAQWLAKAAEAAPDPAWLCSVCGAAHTDWQPTCRSCGSFATLEWHKPGMGQQVTRLPSSILSDWSE